MNCEILCVGTEILLGDIVNTNAHYLSRRLAELGVNVLYQTAVGDNPGRLRASLRIALSRADLVITSGGLGPTEDDLTKETIAEELGFPLVLHEESLRLMEAYFARMGRVMTANNRKQALQPEGATVLRNDYGTAPGCFMETVLDGETKRVAVLPGPPRELKPMFESGVAPLLSALTGETIVSRSIRTFGIGESTLEGYVTDFTKGTNPTAALYAKSGEALIRITAKAPARAQAESMLDLVESGIVARLKDFVYGIDIDNLQDAVVNLLVSCGSRVAVAESCTGGLIASKLTSVPGASAVFDCGVCAYANRIKTELLGVPERILAEHGAVSEETAALMAEGVMKLAGADIGVATTGIAGPTGGTEDKPVGLVYVSVASKNAKTTVKRLLLGHPAGERTVKEREYIRELAALHALNLVRLTASGMCPEQGGNPYGNR